MTGLGVGLAVAATCALVGLFAWLDWQRRHETQGDPVEEFEQRRSAALEMFRSRTHSASPAQRREAFEVAAADLGMSLDEFRTWLTEPCERVDRRVVPVSIVATSNPNDPPIVYFEYPDGSAHLRRDLDDPPRSGWNRRTYFPHATIEVSTDA